MFAAVTGTFAQEASQTRSITSDDFASQRPPGKVIVSKSGVRKTVPATNKRYTYKFVRSDKNAVRWNSGTKAPVQKTSTANLPAKITEIGVTMWKLRPPLASEKGLLMLPVQIDDKGNRQNWLAERINPDTVFKAGDKVRFAVESSTAGYLYVFDRETYSDGTFGEPSLIFPESPSDDASVRPGLLADFPDRATDVPYFNINPKKPKYTGELLTVIISPKPWINIKIDKDGFVKNGDDLIDLEFGADIEIFRRTDTSDKIYSIAESDSSCGVKSRQLEKEKPSEKPCGVSSRQLTREEPLPQSIYRVKGLAGQPAVAFVKLAVH